MLWEMGEIQGVSVVLEVVYTVCTMVERPLGHCSVVWWVMEPFEYEAEALGEAMVAWDLHKGGQEASWHHQ